VEEKKRRRERRAGLSCKHQARHRNIYGDRPYVHTLNEYKRLRKEKMEHKIKKIKINKKPVLYSLAFTT